jgi:hypothetical protein
MTKPILFIASFGLLMAACSTSKTVASGPTVRFAGPVPTSVKGNVVDLDLAATGITIVKPDGDTSGKTGHYHIFIDREPVAPGQVVAKEPGIVHSPQNPTKLTGLSVGRHRLVVVLGDGSHRRIGSSSAEATVAVEGPSIHAKAPATVTAGSPVVVDVAVTGVTLVKADGDATDKTGHLHVFVDREPTATGQPIPKEAGIIHTAEKRIAIPGLTAGEHTIWVVLGNGVHVPFDAPVLDKMTVTVV